MITSCFATCCNLVPRAHGLHGQQSQQSGQPLTVEAGDSGYEIASVVAQTSAFVNFHNESLFIFDLQLTPFKSIYRCSFVNSARHLKGVSALVRAHHTCPLKRGVL